MGDSKIETALSKLKGGRMVVPPKLVVTGLTVQSRNDLSIRRLGLFTIRGGVESTGKGRCLV